MALAHRGVRALPVKGLVAGPRLFVRRSPQQRTGIWHKRHLNALGNGLGDGAMRSPLDFMDSQMQFMAEQMRDMDREFMDMDQLVRREMEQTLQDSRRLTDQINREVNSELEKARQATEAVQISTPEMSIRRSEQRAPGSYRYYESIQIRSGYANPYHTLAAQQTMSTGPSSMLLAAALVLAGAYAAVTATFNKSYDMTTFRPEARWKLLLLWPFLLAFSPKFREQFLAVIQGRPAPQQEDNKGDRSN